MNVQKKSKKQLMCKKGGGVRVADEMKLALEWMAEKYSVSIDLSMEK